jgi:thioredoxin reductase
MVNQDFMTNLPGLFAAGDVTHHPFKQIVIAVGDGAKAALAIQQYLLHHS